MENDEAQLTSTEAADTVRLLKAMATMLDKLGRGKAASHLRDAIDKIQARAIVG